MTINNTGLNPTASRDQLLLLGCQATVDFSFCSQHFTYEQVEFNRYCNVQDYGNMHYC